MKVNRCATCFKCQHMFFLLENIFQGVFVYKIIVNKLLQNKFGSAGQEVVIEERLYGEELSVGVFLNLSFHHSFH